MPGTIPVSVMVQKAKNLMERPDDSGQEPITSPNSKDGEESDYDDKKVHGQ